jgi:hypothetical protein
MDVVASPYGPCEIDCTGDVACWPWNRSTSQGAPETPASASVRLGIDPQTLREVARARGHHPWAGRGRPPKGCAVGLPSDVWDAIAAAHIAGRKRPGPKVIEAERRVA